MQRRFFSLFVLLALLLAGIIPALQTFTAQAAPTFAPPSGWVKAQVVGGGCDAQGRCSSDVRPGSPTLYEYKPDRQAVGRNFNVGANLADHGGYPSYVDREKCHIGTTDYYWSAGIWHHGGYWTLTFDAQGREVWSGPTREHWAFEHNDVCEPIPRPIPTNTPVPPPPGAPTYTPVPTQAVPTPTDVPPPAPCTTLDPAPPEERRTISLLVDGYTIPEKAYTWDDPVNSYYKPPNEKDPLRQLPPYALVKQSVEAGIPLAIGFGYDNLETKVQGQTTQYVPGHTGQSAMYVGLRDVTANKNLLLLQPEDIKRDGYDDIGVGDWGWDSRYGWVEKVGAGTISFLPARSTTLFEQWDKSHNDWVNRTAQPVNNSFLKRLGKLWLEYVPEPDHVYVLWSWNGRGPCKVEVPRWTIMEFKAGAWANEPTPVPPTLIPTNTPTPTPSPTPLPPAPPVPNAQFTISIHSTLGPNGGDGDARNGVYTSDGNTISWPTGEVLDFTPRVKMTLNPAAPAYSGYAFRAHVQDWRFVSSLGQNAATSADGLGRTGCRGSGTRTSGASGPACSYAYFGGASLVDTTTPTEAEMASQAHVYWAEGAPRQMRSDVYVYNLGRLQAVDLIVEVRITVEVVNVATGEVVASRTDTTSGTFVVKLVVPRSAK